MREFEAFGCFPVGFGGTERVSSKVEEACFALGVSF